MKKIYRAILASLSVIYLATQMFEPVRVVHLINLGLILVVMQDLTIEQLKLERVNSMLKEVLESLRPEDDGGDA